MTAIWSAGENDKNRSRPRFARCASAPERMTDPTMRESPGIVRPPSQGFLIWGARQESNMQSPRTETIRGGRQKRNGFDHDLATFRGSDFDLTRHCFMVETSANFRPVVANLLTASDPRGVVGATRATDQPDRRLPDLTGPSAGGGAGRDHRSRRYRLVLKL